MSHQLPPSIFNDVLGPVMRGPSSSHSAASVRIGKLARDLAGGWIDEVLIEFDPNGSLATTHDSQGSDIGLFAGLLGWEADDARLPDSQQHAIDSGIKSRIEIRDIGARHPNTYRLTVTNHKLSATHTLEADSLGGGMIVVNKIDDTPLQLFGDYRVTLMRGESADLTVHSGTEFLSDSEIAESGSTWSRKLDRVLPVPSRAEMTLPFLGTAEMTALADPTTRPLSQWAIEYESARSGWSESEVLSAMQNIYDIMRGSLNAGLAGTQYDDRVLGVQSRGFNDAMKSSRLLGGDSVVNQMVLYVTAIMEAKSAMEVIVAAPTAGSCGTFPGTCFAAIDELKLAQDRSLRAMLGGGLIGVFVAIRSSFAAEVGGCQAETGAGAAMAAASLVEMMGGNAAQSLSAASLALQNVLGLVCDPVANRVEAPCLGRNVAGASNAFVSANMALAGYDALIPFDEVLDAHRSISESMPRELRCTALGGLSISPTSKAIEARLCGGRGCDSCG